MDPGTTMTLEQLQAWNKGLVDELLESYNSNGFTFNGDPYNSDSAMRQKIVNAATFALLASNLGQPLPVTLGLQSSASGGVLQAKQQVQLAQPVKDVQSTDVIGLGNALLTFLTANESNALTHKGAIDALQDMPSVLDYDVTTGWTGNDPFPPAAIDAEPVLG